MSSQVYVGNKYALTFPVMCDGYLKIDYSDNVATQDYGIFNHDDSFTVEAIITPFDINGFGFKLAGSNSPASTVGVVDSIKTMPTVQEYNMTDSNMQSHVYRPEANRITDKMMIFYNGSVQLYLQNATVTTHNQPAEYKIGMDVTAGSVSDTLLSDIAIGSSLEHTGEGAVFHGEDSVVKYVAASANVNTHTAGSDEFVHNGANGADDHFWVGQELFTLSGQTFTSIGKVNSVTSDLSKVVELDAVVAADLDGQALYTHANREALYLANSFHIAWAFNLASGNMAIYLNGQRIATKKHSNATASSFDFSFVAEDSYMGQDPNTGTPTQFMGQMHEIAFIEGYKTEYNSLFTLAPNFNKTLLYYRFEEVSL